MYVAYPSGWYYLTSQWRSLSGKAMSQFEPHMQLCIHISFVNASSTSQRRATFWATFHNNGANLSRSVELVSHVCRIGMLTTQSIVTPAIFLNLACCWGAHCFTWLLGEAHSSDVSLCVRPKNTNCCKTSVKDCARLMSIHDEVAAYNALLVFLAAVQDVGVDGSPEYLVEWLIDGSQSGLPTQLPASALVWTPTCAIAFCTCLRP